MDKFNVECLIKEIFKDWAITVTKVCFLIVSSIGGLIALMYFGVINFIPTVGFYYTTFHLPNTDTVAWTLCLGYWVGVLGVAFLIIDLIGKLRTRKNG